jgi:uncharacterized protein
MRKPALAAIVTGILIGLSVFCPLSFAEDQGQVLIKAVKQGDLEQIRELVDKGADVNAKDEDGFIITKGRSRERIRRTIGWTPLMLATYYDRLETAELLIAKGADVNAESPRGETALIASAQSGSAAIVDLLLKNRADVNKVASLKHGGVTALMKAASGADVVKLLLQHGANPNFKDQEGKTALMMAATGWGPRNAEATELLLDKGAEINSRDESGKTALMAAAGAGSPEVVKRLLERGAEANSTDYCGKTALMYVLQPACAYSFSMSQFQCGSQAVTADDMDRIKGVVQLLLEKGADINAKDKDGWTALLCASEPLIEVEANGTEPPRIEYEYKGTALSIKVANGAARVKPNMPVAIIELLKAHGAKE